MSDFWRDAVSHLIAPAARTKTAQVNDALTVHAILGHAKPVRPATAIPHAAANKNVGMVSGNPVGNPKLSDVVMASITIAMVK